MISNVPHRRDVRRAFAALLETALVGSGKPAQKVYRYRPSDLKGKFAAAAVTSAPVHRAKQARETRTDNRVKLEAHTFTLYAEPGVIASNNPAAGSNVVILLDNTEMFAVGDTVTVEDSSNRETATVTVVAADTSITVNTLADSYTKPNVTVWSEEDAENRMDWLEKAIADVVMENDTLEVVDVGMWTISYDGDTDIDFPVIGGREYLHETIPLVFEMYSD